MKKLYFLAVLVLAFVLAACNINIGSTSPTVSGVTVSPHSANLARGSIQQFYATVNGTNNPDPNVTWLIVEPGKHSDTVISTSGRLTVSAAETLSALTIRATSTFDTSRHGDAAVTITSEAPPSVTSVMVSPTTATVVKGGAQTFSATVLGTNNPDQTVEWSIVETGKHSDTGISEDGILAVSADETLTTLTVKAVSIIDTGKSATATVTVIAPSPNQTVTSVTVSPSTVTVAKGGTQQFTATVTGTNDPPETVIWTVTQATGNLNGTSIDSTGLLTVHQNQNTTTLTVTATSTFDNSKKGTATVTVPPSNS